MGFDSNCHSVFKELLAFADCRLLIASYVSPPGRWPLLLDTASCPTKAIQVTTFIRLRQ